MLQKGKGVGSSFSSDNVYSRAQFLLGWDRMIPDLLQLDFQRLVARASWLWSSALSSCRQEVMNPEPILAKGLKEEAVTWVSWGSCREAGTPNPGKAAHKKGHPISC